MNFSECQTATDAVADAGQYEERQSLLNSLSFRFAMDAAALPADKVRRQKRLQNRAKDRQKRFAFHAGRV